MNKQKQAQQLRLAAEIIETGHPFEAKLNGSWQRVNYAPPLIAIANGNEIRLALATPPDGRPLHNPDGLSAEQVGAGWRLFLPEEVDCRHDGKCELWWVNEWLSEEIEGSEHECTYRLPLSVPWPEAPKPEPQTKTVPLGPEDVPPGSVFRHPEWQPTSFRYPKEVNQYGVHWTGDGTPNSQPHNTHSYQLLREQDWKINRPRHRDADGNPTLWEPCHKIIPAAP